MCVQTAAPSTHQKDKMLQALTRFLSQRFGKPAPATLADTADASVAAAPAAPRSTPMKPPPAARPVAAQDADNEPVLMRRDVLDAQLGVCGYAFSLRTELRDKLRTDSHQVRDFLDGMLVDQLAAIDPQVFGGRNCFLQLWDSSLQRIDPARLPPHTGVLLVPGSPNRTAEPALLARLAAWRNAGVEIWLDDCAGTPWFASAIEHAHGALIRMALRLPTEVAAIIEGLRRDFPGVPRAAWDIGTQEEFEFALGQGCTRFMGGFVTRRNDWSGRALSPQVLAVAALINELRQGADMREIARVLKQDMAMSYRLLRYVNTAARGLNQPLSSIEQALMILGQAQLDRWLTLLMLGGGLGGNSALMEAALVRARFLELLGEGRLNAEQCERLFVLGLFSMLDVALRVPLEEALQPLNLPELMRMALLRHKGPLGAYLSLVEACERGQADKVLKFAVSIGLSVRRVNARHLEALAWVNAPDALPTPA